MINSMIQDFGEYKGNRLFVKREDLIPFSFGGNKARKAQFFLKEIDKGNYDSVVTYGTESSNHCRIVANECCRRNIGCFIVSPEGESKETFNLMLMRLLGAHITKVPVAEVHETIEYKMEELKNEGKKPYFIAGGGHGDLGTKAYIDCYREIRDFEKAKGVHFDYIFLASGTGTTQAGLICGKILYGGKERIIGISIARKNPRGREVIIDSVKSYLSDRVQDKEVEENTIFIDDYTSGYGNEDRHVNETIKEVMKRYGLPLDKTYTGKAFMGMKEYLNNISNKNVLFIHTGGTPLFFDALRSGL